MAGSRKNGRIVGLSGHAGCGKTTIKDVLVSIGWHNVNIAGTLKSMASALFIDCGLDPEDCIDGHLKEKNLEQLNGSSPRKIMQTLGTEWGRDCVSDTIWVDIAKIKCSGLLECGLDVVVDDVRFQNEADMIRSLGGIVVGITGRGGIGGSHKSEAGVGVDFNIDNSLSLDHLRNDALYLLHRSDF